MCNINFTGDRRTFQISLGTTFYMANTDLSFKMKVCWTYKVSTWLTVLVTGWWDYQLIPINVVFINPLLKINLISTLCKYCNNTDAICLYSSLIKRYWEMSLTCHAPLSWCMQAAGRTAPSPPCVWWVDWRGRWVGGSWTGSAAGASWGRKAASRGARTSPLTPATLFGWAQH